MYTQPSPSQNSKPGSPQLISPYLAGGAVQLLHSHARISCSHAIICKHKTKWKAVPQAMPALLGLAADCSGCPNKCYVACVLYETVRLVIPATTGAPAAVNQTWQLQLYTRVHWSAMHSTTTDSSFVCRCLPLPDMQQPGHTLAARSAG